MVVGRAAEYPADSTAATRSSRATVAGKSTLARSVAKFTDAVTPSSLLRRFSMRAAHDAQVMPSMVRST